MKESDESQTPSPEGYVSLGVQFKIASALIGNLLAIKAVSIPCIGPGLNGILEISGGRESIFLGIFIAGAGTGVVTTVALPVLLAFGGGYAIGSGINELLDAFDSGEASAWGFTCSPFR
jgi:hypothetical protein